METLGEAAYIITREVHTLQEDRMTQSLSVISSP